MEKQDKITANLSEQTGANINREVNLDSIKITPENSKKGNKQIKVKKENKRGKLTYKTVSAPKRSGNCYTGRKEDGIKDFRGNAISNAQDPTWYAQNKEMIDRFANLTWMEVVGSPISPNILDSVPGLMKIRFKHSIGSTFGNSGNYQDRAASAFFNYYTQGYSSNVPFMASDLLFTSVAGSSLMAALAKGARAFGCLNYYLQFNKYWARDIITGLGFDFDDLRKNKANFCAEFNIRVDEVNKIIQIPKSLSLFSSWIFHESYLFTDTNSPDYSTVMAFDCESYIKYDSTSLTTGTGLVWEDFGEENTVEDYFSFIDTLINALQNEDARQMFGAVARVYNESDLIRMNYLPLDYQTPIVRNDIISAKIHNLKWTTAKVAGYAPEEFYLDENVKNKVAAYQDETGHVQAIMLAEGTDVNGTNTTECAYQPELSGSTEIVIDMYDHQATSENVLDITDGMNVYTNTEFMIDGDRWFGIKCRGLLYTGVDVFTYNLNTKQLVKTSIQPAAVEVQSIVSIIPISHVDSHPLIAVKQQGSISLIKGFLGEIDKYTTISYDQLAKLHDRTFYQLLSMSSNTKSVT